MASNEQGSSFQRSQSAPGFIPGQGSVYKPMLKRSNMRWGALQQGMQQAMHNVNSQMASIYSGYHDAGQQAMHTLGVDGGGWGVASPAAQAIQRTFAQQNGQMQQDMISRGLGNSTVLANLQQGNLLNYGEAMGGLGAQLAQTAAGYQFQANMGGLGAKIQGLGMQTDLSKAYMGDVTGFRFNEFSPLTGQFSSSTGGSTNQGQSANPMMGGGGGGGSGIMGNEPYFGPSNNPGDLSVAYGTNSGGKGSGAITGQMPSWQSYVNGGEVQYGGGPQYSLGGPNGPSWDASGGMSA
jgi:hypothetical protein